MQSSPDAQTAQKIVEWLERVQIELRQIVRQLVPVEIDELGLVAALRGLTEQTTQMHDLDCSFDCPETAVRITNSTLATHLYRIAQEAVRNAVQHAKASHVRIILSEDEGMLKLEVEDDGVGIMPDIQRQTGLGLRSMAYRASLIGAKIDYHPRDKGGTRVACTVFTGGDR